MSSSPGEVPAVPCYRSKQNDALISHFVVHGHFFLVVNDSFPLFAVGQHQDLSKCSRFGISSIPSFGQGPLNVSNRDSPLGHASANMLMKVVLMNFDAAAIHRRNLMLMSITGTPIITGTGIG